MSTQIQQTIILSRYAGNLIAIALCGAIVVLGAPEHVRAGYFQGSYYSEASYYSQASYQTTFTQNATAAQNLTVTGHISKGSGTFVIDHPLDPKNKLLFHSFVESPDVKDFYDGVATLDEKGEATIVLPSYFMALNDSFRYQLTPIGQPQPNLHIQSEVDQNQFAIAGGASGGRVSWQITGIRHDPYILANPILVEVKKGPGELEMPGSFLHEGLYPNALISQLYFVRTWLRKWLGGRV